MNDNEDLIQEIKIPKDPEELKKAKARMKQYGTYKDTTMIALYELYDTSTNDLNDSTKIGETTDLEEAEEWEKKGRKIFCEYCPDYPLNSRHYDIKYKRIAKPQS